MPRTETEAEVKLWWEVVKIKPHGLGAAYFTSSSWPGVWHGSVWVALSLLVMKQAAVSRR